MLPCCRLTEFGDVISLGGQEVVEEVLKRLLCKAPKHQYEEAFDEARVGPVPDRLVLCVLFLNGPAVGPCQKVPEENIEEAMECQLCFNTANTEGSPDVQSLLDRPWLVIKQGADNE